MHSKKAAGHAWAWTQLVRPDFLIDAAVGAALIAIAICFRGRTDHA